MFVSRKVWFRPSPNALKTIKRAALSGEQPDFRALAHGAKFHYSPVYLIVETARSGFLDGKIVSHDCTLAPTGICEEEIAGLRAGTIECDDLEPELLPITEAVVDQEFTIATVYAVCYDQMVVRIGDKEEMEASAIAFNAVLAECEASCCLELVRYHHLFDCSIQGSNWIALVPDLF